MAAAIAVAAAAPSGAAAWQVARSGTGSAHARVLQGATAPSGTASVTSVTLTWTAATFVGGGNVPSYVVKRYDILGNLQTTGVGCSGIVSGTSCVETGVALGTWQYTVTPALGLWRGTESPHSANVIVTGL
ncbi:MAG: hypothetical protein WBB74_10480 [Gaiellaceae bacterium]